MTECRLPHHVSEDCSKIPPLRRGPGKLRQSSALHPWRRCGCLHKPSSSIRSNDERVETVQRERDDAVVTVNCEPDSRSAPRLEVELAESPRGYLARFRGDLVADTMAVLWGIEPILLNETRIPRCFRGHIGRPGRIESRPEAR